MTKQRRKKTRSFSSAQTVDTRPLFCFLTVSPFFFGLFHECLSVGAGIFLFGYWCYLARIRGGVRFRWNLVTASVVLITIGYLVSVLWAIDRIMALYGILKFSPLLGFALVLLQLEPEEKAGLLDSVPLAGTGMTILSYLGSLLSFSDSFFTVEDGLAGFFQYPNSFALFLLLGVIVLGTREQLGLREWISGVVLLLGIWASQSRAVLVLTVFVILILLLCRLISVRDQKKRTIGLLSFCGFIAVGIAAAIFLGAPQWIAGVLKDTSLYARLMYLWDAFPVILSHPFGLGYLGYYYLQPQFQHTLYSVMFVHNEVFQLFLDIGWIPAVCFVTALVRAFFSKDFGLRERLLLGTLLAHLLLDFDLQFISVWFVLYLVLDRGAEKGRVYYFAAPQPPLKTALALAAVGCLYLGAAQGIYLLGDTELSQKLYPNTNLIAAELAGTDSLSEAERLADRILAQNDTFASAYSVRAQAAFSAGKFKETVEYQKAALQRAPYDQDYYVKYAEMLVYAIDLYERKGDSGSASYCRDLLGELDDLIRQKNEEVPSFARYTADAFVLAFPASAEEYLP